ncbi:MAG: guanylate kinase [Pseudomonadota bacterium]
MFVLSSPSGAGKTTLSRALLAQEDAIDMSISMTTRTPRPGEKDGVDYFFADAERFHEASSGGELLEYATVFGNSYGTPRGPVLAALEAGRDVLFDIDWQGAQQLREAQRDDVVSVFILPPSGATLEERLVKRAQDSAETVRARMSRASEEISHWSEYDYVIVNEDVGRSLHALRGILVAERHRRDRQTGLVKFVNAIRREL